MTLRPARATVAVLIARLASVEVRFRSAGTLALGLMKRERGRVSDVTWEALNCGLTKHELGANGILTCRVSSDHSLLENGPVRVG
jgi:hypothetical protein